MRGGFGVVVRHGLAFTFGDGRGFAWAGEVAECGEWCAGDGFFAGQIGVEGDGGDGGEGGEDGCCLVVEGGVVCCMLLASHLKIGCVDLQTSPTLSLGSHLSHAFSASSACCKVLSAFLARLDTPTTV